MPLTSALRRLDGSESLVPDERVLAAMRLLEVPRRYATDCGDKPLRFPVRMRELRSMGLIEADVLWLLRKGLVATTDRVTIPCPDARARAGGRNVFADSTPFFLTDEGAIALAQWAAVRPLSQPAVLIADHAAELAECAAELPVWDRAERVLSLRGRAVKKFGRHAPNQFCVLDQLEEVGWQERIEDPLPESADVEAVGRVYDTVKNLNRGLSPLIRFRALDGGKMIGWRYVERGC